MKQKDSNKAKTAASKAAPVSAAADEAKNKPAAKKKSKKRQARVARVAFVISLIVLMFVFGWIGYVSAYIYPLVFGSPNAGDKTETVITEEQREAFASGKMTVLLLGSDKRGYEAMSRSDTLMLAYVDLDTDQIRLLSIPRDTYITIPTTGEETKINHAYAYGGVDLMKQTLAYNFHIEPDYYLDVDFQGFIDIINAIGGITLSIPEDMHYEADPMFPEDNIDLSAGVQTLDGMQSLQYCRFRNDGMGDLGRIDRQQAFLVALKEKMFSAGTLLHIPELCTAVMSNMETDFAGTQMLQIMLQFRDGVDFQTYQPDNIPEYKDEISYVFITEKGKRLIDTLNAFEPIPSDIEPTTNKIDITPDAANNAAATDKNDDSDTEE